MLPKKLTTLSQFILWKLGLFEKCLYQVKNFFFGEEVPLKHLLSTIVRIYLSSTNNEDIFVDRFHLIRR